MCFNIYVALIKHIFITLLTSGEQISLAEISFLVNLALLSTQESRSLVISWFPGHVVACCTNRIILSLSLAGIMARVCLFPHSYLPSSGRFMP